MSTQFDKELDRLFEDWGLENWSVKSEAKEAIKKAVEVHIIGEDITPIQDSDVLYASGVAANAIRKDQRKHLYGEDK